MDLGLRISLRNRCMWLVAGRWGLSRVISHCLQICSRLHKDSQLHKLGMIQTVLTAIEQVIIYY